MFKITKAYIESLATNQSYSRGLSYYKRGEVDKVIQKGDTFEGKVEGSAIYTVTITLNDKGISSNCSCPYDWGGICKHIVAVGLAIANNDFKKDENYVSEANFFDHIYPQLSAQVKQDFLTSLLKQDSAKRSELMQFAGVKWSKDGLQTPNTIDLASGLIDIDSLAAMIRTQLVDFDPDEDDNYREHERSGYYDEEDPYFLIAQKNIDRVFNAQYEKYSLHLRNLHFVEGFKAMIALYEACQLIENIPDGSDYGYNNADFEYWAEDTVKELWRQKLAELIATVPKTEQDVYLSIDIWVKRLEKWRDLETLEYDFQLWATIIEAILLDSTAARYILEKLRQNDLVNVNTAPLLLLLAEACEDSQYWLDIAEAYAEQDEKIGFLLFDKYVSLQQKTDLLRIAQSLFDKYPTRADEYIIPYLSPETDKSLFLRVASHLVARKGDINGYNALRELWTETERRDFIAQQRAKEVFYVRLLQVHEEYDAIFKYVQARTDSFHFVTLIQPIINHFPLEIIGMVSQKIDAAMRRDRSRATYNSVASWCIPLLQIEAEQAAVQTFIEHLVKIQYHKLPAFKDEFKKAGLIK